MLLVQTEPFYKTELFWIACGSIATAISAFVTIFLWLNTREAVGQTAKTIRENEQEQRAIALVGNGSKFEIGGTGKELSFAASFEIKNYGRSVATNIKVRWSANAPGDKHDPIEAEIELNDLVPNATHTVSTGGQLIGQFGTKRLLDVVTTYRTAGSSTEYASRSFYLVEDERISNAFHHIVDWSPPSNATRRSPG